MTSRKRGAANLGRFNEARAERHLQLVEQELEKARTLQLRLAGFGELQRYLTKTTGIGRTTFTRNVAIRSLLIDHLRKTPGAAAHASADTDHLGLLKAKLALALAETGNLRRDVQRLRSELSKANHERNIPIPVDADAVSIANLYVLLALVIGRAETFAIDVAKRSIIDLGAKPSEQLVAGPERASDFIAWIRNEPGLPFIKNLRLKE